MGLVLGSEEPGGSLVRIDLRIAIRGNLYVGRAPIELMGVVVTTILRPGTLHS